MAVDIVHAVVPELYGTATHHLLVIKEDPEARAMSPLQSPVSENLPDRQDIRKEAIAGNERQRTREEMLHPLRQISEMTLLVNASTELIEIEQAVIQCAPCAPKEEEEDATTLGVLNSAWLDVPVGMACSQIQAPSSGSCCRSVPTAQISYAAIHDTCIFQAKTSTCEQGAFQSSLPARASSRNRNLPFCISAARMGRGVLLVSRS